ncbi:hypothetical protein FF1_043778 [Malus domestica]
MDLYTFPVEGLLQSVTSFAASEIGLFPGFKKELTELRQSSLEIQQYLGDVAHQPRDRSMTVRIWVKNLKDVAHDVDDVLEDINYEVLRRTEEIQNHMKKKEEMLVKSRNRVILAWTLVALCCGSHASHILHSLGIHAAHGSFWELLHNSYVKAGLATGALLGPGRDLLFDAFFDEPVMLLGFVLLGRSLEERARIKASSDMNELLSLMNTQARLVIGSPENDSSSNSVLFSDAICVEVPTDKVRVGDSVLVFPGETIPVDGRVVAGRSVIDESMLTGESLPVFKEKDLTVSAGTINWDGPLRVEASSTGSNSMIFKIVRMVEDAQGHEAPIQRLADSIVGPFVYSIMTLSDISLSRICSNDKQYVEALSLSSDPKLLFSYTTNSSSVAPLHQLLDAVVHSDSVESSLSLNLSPV